MSKKQLDRPEQRSTEPKSSKGQASYAIERNIPIPSSRSKGNSRRSKILDALMNLDVGESVLFPDTPLYSIAGLYALAAYKKADDRRFTGRTMPGGVRVWRVA